MLRMAPIHLGLLLLLVASTNAMTREIKMIRHIQESAEYMLNAPPEIVHELETLSIDRILTELSESDDDRISAAFDEVVEGVSSANGAYSFSECELDVVRMAAAMTGIIFSNTSLGDENYTKNVLLPALDAAGKPGAGILRGHTQIGGLFTECINIDYKGSKHYKMDFFRIFMDQGLQAANQPDSCQKFIALDACMPASCTPDELTKVLKIRGDNSTSSICHIAGVNDHVPEVVAGTYIVGIWMAILVVVSVVSGFFDFYIHKKLEGNPIRQSMIYRMFHAFSFYTNVREVFTVGQSGKKEGQIGPVHCIRFFSMCWVISGHLLMYFFVLSANPLDVLSEFKQTTTEILTNAYFAVDSFFFLSGLLLAFVFFKSVKRNRRATMSPISWVMFYVHRLLRLSPPYYFAILFYTFVFSTWMKDMPSYVFAPNFTALDDPCRKNWWINLLYIHNFVRYEHQCYLVSWYLSTDLQIYLFAPLILIPLVISPIVGIAVALLLLALSTGANIFSTFHYYFPPSDLVFGVKDPRATDQSLDTYTLMMYNAPWIRCQVYIVGILCGWFLQQKQRMRINPIVNIVLWLLTGALMLTVMLGLHNWTNGTEIDLGWRAMYSAFSKPAWAIGLSWIVISSFYGYGGVINAFMSWNIFVPLGRLSYSAYLIHYFILQYAMGMSQTMKTYTSFSEAAISTVIPIIFIVFLFSTVWTAVFEIPFAKIEMILLGGLRPSSANTNKPKSRAATLAERRATLSALRKATIVSQRKVTISADLENGHAQTGATDASDIKQNGDVIAVPDPLTTEDKPAGQQAWS